MHTLYIIGFRQGVYTVFEFAGNKILQTIAKILIFLMSVKLEMIMLCYIVLPVSAYEIIKWCGVIS